MNERLDESNITDWLYNSNAAWRLMALCWLGPRQPTEQEQIRASKVPPLNVILQSDSGKYDWGGQERYYRDKFFGLSWRLMLIADLGITRVVPGVETAVENFLSWSDNGCGGFTYHKYRPSFPCISGFMINSLARIGYGQDSRVIAVGEWLNSSIRDDDGWACPARMRDTVHATSHSCLSCTFHVISGLKALQDANHLQFDGYCKGLEFLLRHRLFRSNRNGEIVCKLWLKTGFPSFINYSLIRGANLIANAGFAHDERVQEAFDIITDSRLSNGAWAQGWTPQQPSPYRGEEEGEPDRAVTIINWDTLVKAGRLAPPQPQLD